MFNLNNAGELAKNAVQGLQKAEKLGGETGDVAKNILAGVKKAEKLAGEKAPEQMTGALRKLIAEAGQLAHSSAGKNAALDACLKKAQALLEGGSPSTQAVTALTAELGALIKGLPADVSRQQPEEGAAAPKPGAGRSAPVPSAGANVSAGRPAEAAGAAAVQFSDVDAGAYYYDAVQWAVGKGIASGTSETAFSPDENCTRAQTITMLWRAAGSPAPKGQDNPFTDVKESAYYYKAALWAAERGIVSGNSLNPDAAVTRAQLAAFLYRDAGSPAVESAAAFTDVPEGAYYSQAVAWVAARGITSGTGEHTFRPESVCTRGQIVTFLYRSRK